MTAQKQMVKQIYYLAIQHEDGKLELLGQGSDSLSTWKLARNAEFVKEHPNMTEKNLRIVILREESLVQVALRKSICSECKRPMDDEKLVVEVVGEQSAVGSEPLPDERTEPELRAEPSPEESASEDILEVPEESAVPSPPVSESAGAEVPPPTVDIAAPAEGIPALPSDS